MKRLVIASAAVALVSSVASAQTATVPQPSPATPVIGHATLWYGIGAGTDNDTDTDFRDLTPRSFGGEAVFGIPGDTFNVQLDLRAQTITGYDYDAENGVTETAVAAHGTFALGGFALGPFAMASANSLSDESDMNWTGFFGADAALQGERVMVQLQGGYATRLNNFESGDGFWNGYFGRIVGNYYLSPNLRLQAEFGYLHGTADDDGGDQLRGMVWGVEAQYKLSGPFALLAGYRGNFTSGLGCEDCTLNTYTEHNVRLGVSLTFGQTLRAIDEAAGLTLPDFVVQLGIADDLP